ncbi:Clp protease N-terminal domain-containing protein [Dactylosporangium sp. NPDC049742]|uniref:Clp protease N-terminal domain-containing protein n=1 Tax=Dactylosporangium sp. NPDC049742 TaxID=3154737 RepID=UPI003428E26A
MFRGSHPDLGWTMGRAVLRARELGHPRTGSEHLLLALTTGTDEVAAVLARHGATEPAVLDAVCRAAPLGAGVADDRQVLGSLGLDVDRLLEGVTPATLDRVTWREPLLPLGAAKARRWAAQMRPPMGLDAQAAFEASLRLALARRERDHRTEHLAFALTALDPGAAWTLDTAGVDLAGLLADLGRSFPPPRRNLILRADRRLWHRSRHNDLVARYQRTTGRTVTSPGALPAVIAGQTM